MQSSVLRHEPGINSWHTDILAGKSISTRDLLHRCQLAAHLGQRSLLPEAWLVMASAWNWSHTAYLSQKRLSLFCKIISLAHTYIS